MRKFAPSRRTLLKGSAAIGLSSMGLSALATRVVSAAPAAEAVTPALIKAAQQEGVVNWYTSADLQVAEKIGKAFTAKYPGVICNVERAGVTASAAGAADTTRVASAL